MDLEKLYKLKEALDDFLENIEMDGVCGFWSHITNEEERERPNFSPTGEDFAVYVVLDMEWLHSQNKSRDLLANRIRKDVKNMIRDYLNLNVYVGSMVKHQCD